MADFDTNDVIRIGAVCEVDASDAYVNVLHVQITAGGGLAFAAAAQDIVEYCDTLYAYIASEQTNKLLDDHISIKNVTQDTVWGNVAWSAYGGGNSAADPTALQVALLAWGRTSISRVQIRKYLGVFTETAMTGGLWQAGVRSAGLNFIDYHIVGQTMTNGLVLRGCAYSYLLDRVTFAVSGTTTAVPVVQRRRRRGRGA